MYLTSDLIVLTSSNVTDFSSSGVNNPEAPPNKRTAPAGSLLFTSLRS